MNLESVLKTILSEASEAIVENQFPKPFLKAVDYEDLDIWLQFPLNMKNHGQTVRKNTEEDTLQQHIDHHMRLNMKANSRAENLTEGHLLYSKVAL